MWDLGRTNRCSFANGVKAFCPWYSWPYKSNRYEFGKGKIRVYSPFMVNKWMLAVGCMESLESGLLTSALFVELSSTRLGSHVSHAPYMCAVHIKWLCMPGAIRFSNRRQRKPIRNSLGSQLQVCNNLQPLFLEILQKRKENTSKHSSLNSKFYKIQNTWPN